MTSQRIMKLLALLAVAAALYGAQTWRSTGEMPSPWLLRGAAAALGLSFVIFVVNPQTRPRLMMQFLAALFALIALFALAADYSAASVSGGPFKFTPIIDRLFDFAPTLVAMIRNFMTNSLGAWAWDPMMTSFLNQSPEIVFMALAAICAFAGRRRQDVQIFTN